MRGIIDCLFYCAGCAVLIVLTAKGPLFPLAIVEVAILILQVRLTFFGMEKRADQAETALAATLMAGETLIASSLQHRALALLKRRTLLAITASRIITLQRGRFGGFTMQDIQWKDLTDVTVRENVLPDLCGADLAFAHSNPAVGPIAVPGVFRDAAFTIYAYAQREEQSWEEKRRVRAIEEMRAASGGMTLQSSIQPAAAHEAHRMFDELGRARQLLDEGTISDAEFQEMKSKILAKL